MNFIKNIFDKNFDESVHLQFQKFSKGEFRNKAVIEAKKAANGKYTIKTSAEFANEFVRFLAEKLGSEKTRVKGAIVSTLDLKNDLKFKDVKQFQGVKRYLVDFEMSGNEIISLLDKFPKNFFALSFSVGENVLKIKPKAPKSAKPGKGDKSPKADFCSYKTKDPEIAKNFIFESVDFKEAKINHTFIIEDLIISDELKKTGNFKLMREEAKRKGKIIRESEIDGKKEKKELPFEA
ncbi:MAG: hypothetical protein WDZ62_02005 [Candidatus Pacearchaeota archaeon]